MTKDGDTATVGVALPVPDPWGEQLQRARTGYGEGRAAHIPTHITLLPPTPATAAEVAQLRGHLAMVTDQTEAFPVMLRGTGTFRPVSQVVYIQVAAGVASCEQLERAVRSGPMDRPLQFPYHPHVTIAHDLPAETLDKAFAELSDFACEFFADRVVMYLHRGDGVWREEEQFALRPAR